MRKKLKILFIAFIIAYGLLMVFSIYHFLTDPRIDTKDFPVIR
jgi:hypothetical protein